ncbi:DUF6207 family protein [Streptomyces griseochromogenes]
MSWPPTMRPRAFQQLLAERWATPPAQHTTRDVGKPGDRPCFYLDLRQQLTNVVGSVVGPSMGTTTVRPGSRRDLTVVLAEQRNLPDASRSRSRTTN